jgi:hypothetical protein
MGYSCEFIKPGVVQFNMVAPDHHMCLLSPWNVTNLNGSVYKIDTGFWNYTKKGMYYTFKLITCWNVNILKYWVK